MCMAPRLPFTRWDKGGREDWHEFAVMLGMRGAHHRANTEKVFMKLEEPDHPVVASFNGQGFALQDEFFPSERHLFP